MADTYREVTYDPIRHHNVTLVIPDGGRIFPSDGEPKIGIEHPGCDQLADLSVELDAFYCQACKWNGRVSGAWAVDRIQAHLHPEDVGRCDLCGERHATDDEAEECEDGHLAADEEMEYFDG